MKLPAGYGQIVKLGGKRRRPFAVRITDGEKKLPDGHYTANIKYLEYFEKRQDAMEYLAKYNAGVELGERRKTVTSQPTFSQVYDGFMNFYQKKNKNASNSALNAYKTAFKNAGKLHNKKFVNIRADDLQAVISDYSDKSRSTVSNLIKLFHGMYKHAMRVEIVEKDYSSLVFMECAEKDEPSHIPFTEPEINTLWDCETAQAVTIMIYTGLRCTEFLTIENANVDLDAHVMRGGIKTKAGKNRIIPIHDAILPLVRDLKNSGKYLFGGDNGMKAGRFRSEYWNPLMKETNLSHTPHDTRHTTATLMEKYGIPLHHRKLILGHSVSDLTEGTYTHVEQSALVDDINLIPARFSSAG